MIDVSCFVGPGPLVPSSLSTPDAVATLLRAEGVTRAAVSPMAGLFHSDPSTNTDLPTGFFHPVPIVDPRWPAVTTHLPGRTAVRITPGSHGYRATEAAALRQICAERDVVLILQMRVADPRNLPPGLALAEVPAEDAITLARTVPTAPMIVAGARAPELATILAATPDPVLADISLAEAPDVLRRAVTTHGAHRLLIGTHTPFLTPAAARQKLTAARLPPQDHEAVSWRNAERLGL